MLTNYKNARKEGNRHVLQNTSQVASHALVKAVRNRTNIKRFGKMKIVPKKLDKQIGANTEKNLSVKKQKVAFSEPKNNNRIRSTSEKPKKKVLEKSLVAVIPSRPKKLEIKMPKPMLQILTAVS